MHSKPQVTTVCAGGQDLASKYGNRAPRFRLPDREWPSKTMTKSPIWLSTDLRDGNQALPNPMTKAQKWRMFKLLVAIGFKQIEVAFPVASEIEFDFTRELIETPGAVPDDVVLEVITPCRVNTIQKAIDSLKGAKRAILFTYLATSDNYRETVLGSSEDEWIEQARVCVEYARSITRNDALCQNTLWSFGFGFEDFANARPEAVLRLAETIKAAWQPTAENPVILGLASSVEASTPNVFADQVEHFSRNLQDRETVLISLHTHNDRGGAVASAELGCLAGGQRVEGCLFGNGERAGNLDLVTAAMNLYSQGIETGLDFSRLDEIRAVYEDITQLLVHPRTPYSGDYYFRAFSGAHQDAIGKGLRKRAFRTDGQSSPTTWQVPYMPLDPADLGKSFDSVMGVNSQSGKGGISWLVQQTLGLILPNALAADFSQYVKHKSIALARSLAADEVRDLFLDTYNPYTGLTKATQRAVEAHYPRSDDSRELTDVLALTKSIAMELETAFGIRILCRAAYLHQYTGRGPTTSTSAYVECARSAGGRGFWGFAVGPSDHLAIRKAVLSVLQRHFLDSSESRCFQSRSDEVQNVTALLPAEA